MKEILRTRIPRRRWGIAWLLSLGVLVNYFDRVNLSVSHAALFTAFGISNVTFGYLSGAYNWTYAMCQLPIGPILDRYGIRRVGRISTFLWGMASFAAAATPGLKGFFAARFLLGVGEAPTFPANAKAIGFWFPVSERSTAMALFDSSAKLSSAIGVPLIGMFLIKFGWRWSFAATGIISIGYFLLFTKFYRDPNEDERLTESERRHIEDGQPAAAGMFQDERGSLGYLLRQKKVIGLALGFGSYNYVFYLLLTWLPSYLSSALHVDLLHSFLYTGVPWLFATFTELTIGGWLADHLIQKGWDANRVRKTILITGTACGLGLLGAVHASSGPQALLWISISIGGLSAAAPMGWSAVSLVAPRGSVGTVGGIVNLSNQISGIAAPILTGYLIAATHSYAWAFGVAGGYLAIGILAYVVLLGRIERVAAEV